MAREAQDLSVVTVHATYYRAGDPYFGEPDGTDCFWLKPFADTTKEVEYPPGEIGGAGVVFTAPNTGLWLNCVGLWSRGTYSCGVEEMVKEDRERFANYFASELFAAADIAKAEHDARVGRVRLFSIPEQADGEPVEVRFFTLWRYECERDSYSGEWDSDVYLLGRIDPAKLVNATTAVANLGIDRLRDAAVPAIEAKAVYQPAVRVD